MPELPHRVGAAEEAGLEPAVVVPENQRDALVAAIPGREQMWHREVEDHLDRLLTAELNGALLDAHEPSVPACTATGKPAPRVW